MNTPDKVSRYLREAVQAIARLEDVNRESLAAAAAEAAQRVAAGGTIRAFGCGHSGLVCQDIYYRAGGLEEVDWLHAERVRLDHAPVEETSVHEKTEGWIAEEVGTHLHENDVVIVVSTSGINATPVDVARLARARGCLVIGIRSSAYDAQTPSRHSSGERLAEVADHALDNLSPVGDTLVPVSGGAFMGSASTACGALLLQALMIGIHEEAAALGHEMPVWVSANVPRPE